ncbi:MAG: CDP-alcohol phosphatidyltransferase family protein [Pseudomonadota bacterium]
MAPKVRAYSVHLLTASGAVFAMLALISAVWEDWATMFLWLLVALIVDGIDGPLARKYDVTTNAPRVDGALLDLIIDYLTYVFIPAYAIFWSELLPGWMGWTALIAIIFASALYFADTSMKTDDYSFSGFPGCWNMLAVVFFATMYTPAEGWQAWFALLLILALCPAMFLPLRFVHPTRTKRWRPLTLTISILWVIFAGLAAWHSFDLPLPNQIGLVTTSLYLLLAGIAQQVIPEKAA